MAFKAWMGIAAAAAMVSCGGSFFGPGARGLPDVFPRVAVPAFENRTAATQLGLDCARALQDRLSAGGRQVVSETRGADLVLRAVVDEIRERPVAFEGSAHVENEIEVVVSLVALSADGTELWRGDGFVGHSLYVSSGGSLGAFASRSRATIDACQEAALDLADDLVDALWEDSPGRDASRRGPAPEAATLNVQAAGVGP